MAKWIAAEDEARFREDLALGHKWVQWVARQLDYQGITAQVPDLQCRDEFEDRRAFRDQGDLFVAQTRVEVRSLGISFLSPRSWPYRQVRVDLVDVFSEKKTTGIFLFVSRPKRSIIGLRFKRGDWTIERGVFDARRRVARDWVVVGREHLVSWEDAVQFLHERQAGC